MTRPLGSVSMLALSASLLYVTPAFAQSATTRNASPVEATPSPSAVRGEKQPTVLAAEPASGNEDIVVTGSRIRRPDFSTPNPVLSLGSAQLEESGTTNITDFLTGYPALQGSSGSSANSGDNAGIGGTGLNLLNLRNLGTDRTLVLVDGRRHVAGLDGSQAVDINSIPSDLIDRIDIVTGGASAIYGADGVSGVVNFVLKRNFSGITARAQAGISGQGDAGQRLLAVTAGTNFASGRGNVAIAIEHGEEDRLFSQDRSYLRGAGALTFVRNPNDPENLGGYTGPTSNGIPDRVPLRDIRYADSSRGGALDVNFDYFPDYQGVFSTAV